MIVEWDPVLTSSVARALRTELERARLRAVRLDPEERLLVLHFRERTLLFRLHPTRGDVTLHPPREPDADARSVPARLLEVHAPLDERILHFRFRRVRGRLRRVEIVVELLTNQWNALLLEGEERTVRHLLRLRETRGRTLAVGRPYTPPPPPGRRGVEAPLDEEAWLELLLPLPPGERRPVLLRNVAWSSSLNAPQLLGDAGAGAATGPGAREALLRGRELWLRLREPDGRTEPGVLETPKGPRPYPLPLPGLRREPAEDILAAIRRAAAGAGELAGEAALVPPALRNAVEERAEAAEARAGSLRRELDEAPDPESTRAVGDLLLARYHEVPQGAERARLTGFDGEEVEVEVDPALAPHENAARYYDRAARSERARERLPRLIRAAEEEAEALAGLLERVRSGDAGEEEILEALPRDPREDRAEGDEEEGRSIPYRRFRSSGGIEIRVGRGARANDDLTFHHSRPDDVWLHARHTAGAHVILRWDADAKPPARDLAEAAVLAALHSKARTSGSVPVDWTRRKYVRKPRKAPPGAVLPDRVSTVFVEPDPELERRLAEE